MTPNEEGTWLYGRDGWCDGQEVRPEVWDVTSQVALAGSNTLHYYGWFNGTDPNPASGVCVCVCVCVYVCVCVCVCVWSCFVLGMCLCAALLVG